MSDDRRTVTTEQATLEDVFVDGTLKISGEFRQNDLSPESKQAIADAGIIDLSSNARNLSASASTPFMEFAFGFPKVAFSHGYHTVIMDGYLRFGITYNIEYDCGDATLRSAKFTIAPRQETNLRMEHTSSMPESVYKHITGGDLRTPLFPVDLSYSVSLPFPVPIVITPTFQIYVGLSQTGRVTVDITGVGSAEVGAECRSDCFKVAGWDPVKQASLQYTVNEVDIQAVKVRGYIRPQFSVLLYGAFGPYAGVELFAEALREATRAHLDAGVTTYAGLSLKISSVVDIDVTVLEGFELLRRRLWSQSTGKMYWTDRSRDKIERANLNGSGRETLISDLHDPNAIAISGGKMYWTDSWTDKIERANLDGNGRDLLISSGLRTPNAIAIADGKMYWTDSGTGKIERANLDGSGRETLIIGLYSTEGIAVSGGKMYWTDRSRDKIERANLNGSGRETIISDLRDPNAIAISGGKMYWTDSWTDMIERANLDGSGRDLLISSGLRTPNAIAIADGKMYWTDSGTGKIERANLDGSSRETLIIGLHSTEGIALVP